MYVIFVFIGICVILWICYCHIQRQIIRRLREMNGGNLHPLCTKDGITENTRNAEFQEFLYDIEGEDDPELKQLKIHNKIVTRITIITFIITFIMGAIFTCKNQ